MEMVKEEVFSVLGNAGFTHHPSDFLEGLASGFTRPSAPGWKISAHASWRGGYIDVALTHIADGGMIGTHHRFHSAAALTVGLGTAVAKLEAVSAQPDLMKCPECGTRWVNVKDSRHGSFLSCQGMQVMGKKPNRGARCRGVSRKIPAIIEYR